MEGFVFGREFCNLIRTFSIEPSHSSRGLRRMDDHLSSLEVMNGSILRDAIVFIIDDITTSGATLHATEVIVEPFGPKAIHKLALLKTYQNTVKSIKY